MKKCWSREVGCVTGGIEGRGGENGVGLFGRGLTGDGEGEVAFNVGSKSDGEVEGKSLDGPMGGGRGVVGGTKAVRSESGPVEGALGEKGMGKLEGVVIRLEVSIGGEV